jgi:hypothetical protein
MGGTIYSIIYLLLKNPCPQAISNTDIVKLTINFPQTIRLILPNVKRHNITKLLNADFSIPIQPNSRSSSVYIWIKTTTFLIFRNRSMQTAIGSVKFIEKTHGIVIKLP